MSGLIRRVLASSHKPRLVGPPHAISNIRPVIYSGSSPVTEKESAPSSPYSLDEFSNSPASTSLPASQWEMDWTMRDNDRNNHVFWLDVCVASRISLRWLTSVLSRAIFGSTPPKTPSSLHMPPSLVLSHSKPAHRRLMPRSRGSTVPGCLRKALDKRRLLRISISGQGEHC